MKISKLSTDEALDLFCRITPYVTNIVSDEALMDTIGSALNTEGMTKAGIMIAAAEKVTALVPIVLRNHRADVYGIVAAVNGMEPDEIARQNFLKTSVQIRDICRDKELVSFFRSFAQQEETA